MRDPGMRKEIKERRRLEERTQREKSANTKYM